LLITVINVISNNWSTSAIIVTVYVMTVGSERLKKYRLKVTFRTEIMAGKNNGVFKKKKKKKKSQPSTPYDTSNHILPCRTRSAEAGCQVVAASFSSGVVNGGILCKLVELTMKAWSLAFYFISCL